jgi:hypothetical protein
LLLRQLLHVACLRIGSHARAIRLCLAIGSIQQSAYSHWVCLCVRCATATTRHARASLLHTFQIVAPFQSLDALCFTYFLCAGPLCWSIFIFRNAIVLHDVDQLTSTFIHLSPALLFWCWRWGGGMGPSAVAQAWPGMFDVCPMEELQQSDECAQVSVLWCSVCPACTSPPMFHD